MKDNQVFIIWNWTWLDAEKVESSDEDNLSESDIIQSVMDSIEDESDDRIPAITHSVTLKSIGCHKEDLYLRITGTCSEKKTREGANILVKLQPEPSNLKDSKAITFMSKLKPIMNEWMNPRSLRWGHQLTLTESLLHQFNHA